MGKPYKDLPMVGVSGFEPEASWTRTKRDTKLRHTPIALILYWKLAALSSMSMLSFLYFSGYRLALTVS